MPRIIKIKKKDLIHLYKRERMTSYEIADIYGCCQATVWKYLRKHGIRCVLAGRKAVFIPKSELKDLYIKKSLSSRKIAKIYKCAYSTIDRKIKGYGFPIRNRAESHVLFKKKDYNGSAIQKSYLVGFATGDLRARRKFPNSETIHIDCGSTKQAQIKLISSLFNDYGRVWISKPNRRGVKQIECSVNNSFSFLLDRRELIDNWILDNKKRFFSFLAGFTDAEGSISLDSNGRAFYALGNCNKKLLKQIKDYLLKYGIPSPKLQESKIKGRTCFGKYIHNQNYWSLRVSKKDSLLNLLRLLNAGIKHKDKKLALGMAIRNIKYRNKLYGRKKK